MGNIHLEQEMRLNFVVSSLLMLAPWCPDENSLRAALVLVLIIS